MHVGAESSGLREHRELGDRIDADDAVTLRCGEELEGLLDRELVGREVVGDRGGVVTALDVGPVAARSDHDRNVVGIEPDGDGIDRGGVDVVEPGGDHGLETGSGGPWQYRCPVAVGRPFFAVAEVEPLEPRHGLGLTAGDGIEIVLHPGRERVVDEITEVLFEQSDHGEGHERRNEGRALLPHVAPILDRAHDRGIGGRPSDAQLLQSFHERGFGVARRGLRGMTISAQIFSAQTFPNGDCGKDHLAIFELGFRIVGTFDVGAKKAREGDRLARRDELAVATVGRRRSEADLDRHSPRIVHLRGDRAHPDQLIEPQFVDVELAGERCRCAERLARRADRLMGLLRVLDLLRVGARGVGQVVLAVELEHLRPGGGESCLRERRGVRPHVGDVAVLVQPLGDAHRALRRVAELAAGFLLERRGHERRVGRTAVRLLLDVAHDKRRGVESLDEGTGLSFVENRHGRCLQQPVLTEILPGGQSASVEGDHGGAERFSGSGRGGEAPLEVPVAGGTEPHPSALALDDEASCHALHPARRQTSGDLLPQDRGDLISVQSVEDPSGLLSGHEVEVEVA